MQECVIPFAGPFVLIAAVVGLLLFVNKAQNWTEKQHDKLQKAWSSSLTEQNSVVMISGR